MGKVAWSDIWSLTKVRLKEVWIRWRVAAVLFGCVLAVASVTSFLGESWNGAWISDVPVFANWMMFAAVVFAFGETYQYRENNQTLGVFPQSNQTRFWSYVLLIHGNSIVLMAIGTILYILCYLLLAFPGNWLFGIQMVYPFDAGLVLAGFSVSVSYVCVICAVLVCLEALYMYIDRWFLVLIWAFFVFCMMGTGFGLRLLETYILPFWTEENSLLLFFLKMAATWFGLLIIAGWLTNHTSYYQRKRSLKLSTWIMVMLGGVLVICALFKHTISFGTTGHTILAPMEEVEEAEYAFSLNGDSWASCIIKRPEGVSEVLSQVEKNVSAHIILAVKEDADCEKGTLQIKYRPPSWLRNEVELSSFYSHHIDAKVNEKGQLYIEYVSEAEHSVTELPSDLKLVFLSPCGTYMNPFSVFQGKMLYKTITGTSGGVRDGYLIILYPPGEELEITHE